MSGDRDLNIMLGAITAAAPVLTWHKLAGNAGLIATTTPKYLGILNAFPKTIEAIPDNPMLAMGPVAAFVGMAALWVVFAKGKKSDFRGQEYKKFIRGTKYVTAKKLIPMVRERKEKQVYVGKIPMPTKCESLHSLLVGGTGTGKSVAMEPWVFSAMCRGDRNIIIDPNGSMLSKFYNPDRDKILNPFDARTQGWQFYNEISDPSFDFENISYSIVPPAADSRDEQWNSYGRLLLTETARKLYLHGDYDLNHLFRITTIEHPEFAKAFLSGTPAESLFVGADQALASARFVLSKQFPAHLRMPDGLFSIRQWLSSGTGNLYITWREDQREALLSLVSAWVDVICSAILSLPASKTRRIWLWMDELASLSKLRSLEAALTKGRKHGLRVVAAIQAESQLDTIYGDKEAITLRSCFRNLIALGGSVTDPDTAEIISKGFGEHEVVRPKKSTSEGSKTTRNSSDDPIKERIILPSDITSLPDLEAFIKFAGDWPVAHHLLPIQPFNTVVEAFVPR
ncbi:type IV secretion system DNA-binding domain-containing protein [Aeromonas salmonicida]|uniref:type IV secretion system DNA-binding domain-containing protein n=1 Tax=Aeromonas salmonicida TaxID=645 RepID=UPI003D02595A